MYVRTRSCPERADFAALCLLAALHLSCAGSRTVACASDLDCGGSTSCDQSQCVSPSSVRSPDLRPRRIAIFPRDDGTVSSASCCRTASFGGHDLLVVGGNGQGGAYRSYLRFELPSLPHEEVVRARLLLTTQPRWCVGDEPFELLVYAVSNGWSQSGLSWQGQPGGTGAPVGRTVVRPTHSGEVVLDLTEIVRRWSLRAAPNQGLVIRAASERTSSRIAWFSSETSATDLRPRLDIEVE